MSCVDLFRQYAVLGDLRQNLNKPVVSQCAGTCYFEAFAAHLESKLSKHYGQPVTVSRAQMFATLMAVKLSRLSELQKPLDPDKTKNGMTDIMSSGDPDLLHSMIDMNPPLILGPKTQSFIYKENQVIRQMQQKASRYLYNAVHARTISESIFFTPKQMAQKSLIETLKQARVQVAEEIVSIFKQSGLPKGKVVEGLQFEMREYEFEFENKKGAQSFIKPEIEEKIIRSLSEGTELFLGYMHVAPYVRKINGREGFITLPENKPPLEAEEIIKQKWGGGHAAALVDVIRTPEGRIEYLVIRNSYGAMGKTDRGYHYISPALLEEYGAAIFDWDIQAEKPRH